MKKILYILTLACLLTSCAYDSYLNDFDETTVYFAHQTPIRTLIVDEYEQIKLGVAFGGRRENTNNEWVEFEVDPSLLEGTSYTLLPSELYSLSNENSISIPSGSFQGDITVAFDMQRLTEAAAPMTNLALPVRITSTSLDQIHESKGYTIILFKYIAKLDGTWYQKGVSKMTDIAKDSSWTVTYSQPTLERNRSNVLNTKTKNEVVANAMGNSDYHLNILMEDSDITLSSEEVANFVDDEASVSEDKKELYIKYKFEQEGILHEVSDTLIFAKRNIVFETW
ncbi:DUF1735 domain-containing protein [Flammeovirga yaeyamensis]|uniref:DUF1735 domain-containing protein n=1 Tax=Flammeovirga yaeyamensis TaxID=367791 RepID=A0AAX1NC60_9BACT|nr:DUF1735 domain-containing protein [Flammeovirga yaeyamensis]MBB3696892.1 hypothetical protein [Flammeovirga yaeyamensis]NMF33556.1 DUF1735 domain-containing protein [Flammeovirga yaeyamensis]QWG05175.1 DUF1735 domain-containing protein [Flammeovirga yaeyamensis]